MIVRLREFDRLSMHDTCILNSHVGHAQQGKAVAGYLQKQATRCMQTPSVHHPALSRVQSNRGCACYHAVLQYHVLPPKTTSRNVPGSPPMKWPACAPGRGSDGRPAKGYRRHEGKESGGPSRRGALLRRQARDFPQSAQVCLWSFAPKPCSAGRLRVPLLLRFSCPLYIHR